MHILHKWGKWEDDWVAEAYRRGRKIEVEVQVRVCSVCNKKKVRRIG